MTAVNSTDLIEWLLQNGGPVVRFRTATELVDDFPPNELASLRQQLLEFPVVQAWLSRLNLEGFTGDLAIPGPDSLHQLGWMVHGSKNTHLENVLGKLAEFGLRKGMPGLDECMLPLMRIFIPWPGWREDAQFQNAWESLVKSVFAWGLLRTSYDPDANMQAYLREYVPVVHKIARDKIFEIYADDSELAGLPKAWSGKPIIKQEVMADYHLPLIHDMYLLANLPGAMLTGEIPAMIDEIVAYVLNPRFQALENGYGYAWIKERRTCYGWGWSPHLIGYYGFQFEGGLHPATLVQRLELMAHFPRARQSAWFQSCLEHLENFRDSRGTYCFPGDYLRENPSGYYVTGAYMGLGETPRKKSGLEIESTYRMLKIFSLMRNGKG
jgi:hypothetical protein